MTSTRTTARHNLAPALTSFVGRHEELELLLATVSSRRLVSLTGVGGCGKTRLALRAAERLAETSTDGPWIVDLSATTDPDQVPRLVAATLEILLEPGGDQVAGLAKQLAERATVLILDTCEHLLVRVAELTDRLLRSCPRLTVVATSREPLGIEGESVWQVSGLNPDAARQLFAERAALVAPRFELTGAEDHVDAVCAKVDHLPLGVELAAAWARALGPAQIASGLDDSIRLLTGGPRGVVPRHQTLRASISWSHALLEPEEQVLFRRLAVFAGTFTIDAVAEVCADSVDKSDQFDWLQLLGRLLDKSLVTVRDVGGDVGYRLLDTIRQYAEQELHNAGEEREVRARHLSYFLRVAELAEPGLDRDQDTCRALLDAHHDNLVKALHWGLDAGGWRAASCRLAAALGRYWFLRGLPGEGLDFLARAIEAVEDPMVRQRLFAAQAALGMVSGRADLLDAAVEHVLSEPDGEPVSRARCLALRTYPRFFQDFEETERLAREAREAAELAGDPFARDWARVIAGYSLQTRNLHDAAREASLLAYQSSMARGDRFCAGFALGIQIFTTMVTGDVRAAVAVGEEVVELVRPLRDYFAVGTNSVNAGQAIGLSGDLERARALIDPVVRSLDEAEDADVVGFMVPDGLLHLWAGELEAAVRAFERGVRRRAGTTMDWTAVRCLPGLAGALRRLGRLETARTTAEEGIELARGFGTPYEETQLIDELARLTAPTDPAQARDLLHSSMARRVEFGLLTNLTDSLEALAELDANEGIHLPRAVHMVAASAAARERMGFPVPRVDVTTYDTLLASLRKALGDAFDGHWEAGRQISLEDAVTRAQRGRGSRDRPSSGWESLTPTEREIVNLVSAGMTNPKVAARLFMSRSTVKTHLSRIYQKLGVTNRTELAAFATANTAGTRQ